MKKQEIEILGENKLFSFEKAKVQTLTLEALERTHKENDVYGNPLRGVYHYALVQQIISLAKQQGFTPEIYDMFAAQNKDRAQPGVVLLPQVEQLHGERAVEAHILRRIFTNIRLTDFDDDENTVNLAVAFHQKGIQVGFGNMVKICHNQCMLNADHYAATYSEYGSQKYELSQILDEVSGWLTNARHTIIAEREKIAQMKQIEINAQQMYTIIGMLTSIRVSVDTSHKEIKSARTRYPLNQSQITDLTEDLMLRFHREGKVTVWDLYDGATNLYKATSMDIPALLPQNRAMVGFINEMFF